MAKLVPWRWEEAFLPRGFEGTKNRTYSVVRALAEAGYGCVVDSLPIGSYVYCLTIYVVTGRMLIPSIHTRGCSTVDDVRLRLADTNVAALLDKRFPYEPGYAEAQKLGKEVEYLKEKLFREQIKVAKLQIALDELKDK